jgi:hypothetical protein
MRALVIAGLLVLAACDVVRQPPLTAAPATSSVATHGTCQPTFARMTPPQVVMDTMIGGASPRPNPTPSRDAWAATGNWIGNDAMWVSLPVDGVFQRRYAKLWMIPLKGGPITIKGKQLDGDGSGTFAGTASDGNIGSGVTFSTPGCWELVYSLAGQDLRFTLKVED